MVTGKFNPVHPGHIFLFEKAKKLGDYLVVVVASDETIKRQNGISLLDAKDRKKVVESLRIVDKAVIGNKVDHFKIVIEEKPDILALGYDQEVSEDWLKEKAEKAGLNLKIVRIKDELKGIKSSIIRERIRK